MGHLETFQIAEVTVVIKFKVIHNDAIMCFLFVFAVTVSVSLLYRFQMLSLIYEKAHVALITASLGSCITRWPSMNTKVEVLPFGVVRRGHSWSSAMSLFDEWHLFLLSFRRNCISLFCIVF